MRQPPDSDLFNIIVWKIVLQIPRGQVATYGQIASMIPPPDEVDPPTYDRWSAQWVGSAMHATPSGKEIPWQRVINSQGKISLPEGSQEALLQRHLLEEEGVQFDEKERIDFEQFGWEGPDEAWLKEHELYPPRLLRKKPKDGQMTLF